MAIQSEAIQAAIRQAEIPTKLQEEVIWHYQKVTDILGNQPALALRSSGAYEDQEFSFAGQFLTKLNVPFSEFFPAYLEVLASQFNRRALVYLCQKKLIHREQAMSVGCLAMIPAVASGVLFTVDPMGRQIDVMLLDATWGLGPALVDGTVTPDQFVLSKRPEIRLIEEHLSEKSILLEGQNKSSGLTTVIVGDEKKKQPALTKEQIVALGRYGLQLEDYFGDPQDIEFAIDPQGKLFLMQARPLTVETIQPEDIQSLSPAGQQGVLLDHGTVACFGVAAGPVYIIQQDEDLANFPEGSILVARHTSARYGMVLHKARGMVIDIGSATSHLAILAREFKVPAPGGYWFRH